jgi:DNA gyrase/topoisomerase IV subunit B
MTDSDVDGKSHNYAYTNFLFQVYETADRCGLCLYCAASTLPCKKGNQKFYVRDDKEKEKLLAELWREQKYFYPKI